MGNINYVKAMFIAIIGVIGGFVADQLGGWTKDMQTLFILMIIDVVMGFLIAALWHKSPKTVTGAAGSFQMWKGLVRKGTTLLIVLVAFRLDLALELNYIRTAVIIAFIVNELVSIVENAGIMGIPIPVVIVKAIDILKQKSETEDE